MAHSFAEPARRRWLWALPLAATAALLIWRPGWFVALGIGVLGCGGVVLVLMLAIYAFALLAPERARRAGIRVADVSFVGQEHASTRLRMIEQPGGACRIEMSRGYYAVSFAALGVAGPGMVALFLARGAISDMRHPMMMFAAAFTLGMCALLAYLLFVYVFRQPSLTMAPGEVVLRRGRSEHARLGRADVAELRSDPHIYRDNDGNEARCYVLVAGASDGSDKRLAASGRLEEIERIAGRMRLLLGLR
jgi:hypothetical protein